MLGGTRPSQPVRPRTVASTCPMARTIGTAGGSLASLDYGAHRVNAGIVGEQKSAKLLEAVDDRFTVLHDLIPPDGYGNVDHAVIGGTTIVLIDSKQWAKGTYRHMFGFLWRGRKPLRGRLDLARDEKVRRSFETKFGCRAVYLVAVHGRIRLGFGLPKRGAVRVVRGDSIDLIVNRTLKRQKAADPRLVTSARRLLAR
jgi:hypothetical protein